MRTVAPVAARRASAPAPRVAAPSRPAARAAVRPLASVGARVTLPANTLRKAGGQPLEPAVRRRLEMSFGADLSAVRVHTDAAAQAIAHRWNARALTQGSDILLGSGQSPTDLELLAHETAHVLQQRGVPVPRPYRPQGGDHFESEARQASHRVLLGQPVTIAAAASAPAVQRWGLSDLGNMVGNLANTIPGFRLLTVVLGFNPISQERVERSAANLLRGLIELMVPVGTVISAALNQYGIFDRAGRWVEQQFQSLDFRVDRIRGVLQRLLNPLETGAQQLLEAEIAPLKRFAMEMAVGLLRFVREAVLLPVADLASKTRGWELLTAVLGRNPITDETVPRKPETLIGGFLKLIGEDEVWQNIQQARALPRIATWFDGVSETVVGYVRELPLLFHKAWETLQIADLTAPITAFHKITQVFGRFVLSFVDWAGQALWTMLEILLDAIKPGVVGYLKKTGSALKSILKNPLPFMGYLIDAAKRGFEGFADRFGTHLKHGLLEWLTGSLPGVYIPKSFAFAEIVKFVFSVLGLSWQNLRAKLVKVVGEGPVTAIENGVTLVTKLIAEGPAAAWQELQETLAGLKDQAISGITQMVTELIVLKAIPKLVAMFIPGAGFIPAALAIYDTIMVFVDKLKQILEVVKSFVDSIVAIAGGAIDAAAKQVERILGRLLSLAISFLMGFAGLGKVADKVLGVIKKLQAAVDKALDKLVDKVVKLARDAGLNLGKAETQADKVKRLDKAMAAAVKLVNGLSGSRIGILAIRPVLAGVRLKHRLTSLEAVAERGVWVIVGKINPEKKKQTKIQTIEDAKQSKCGDTDSNATKNNKAQRTGNLEIARVPQQHCDLRTRDEFNRIVRLTGILKKEHLGTGTKTTEEARKSAQKEGKYHAGHVRGKNMGGLGEKDLTFPQFPSLNSGQFRKFEKHLADTRRTLDESDQILFSVWLKYKCKTCNTPHEILYFVRINGRTTARAHFFNDRNTITIR